MIWTEPPYVPAVNLQGCNHPDKHWNTFRFKQIHFAVATVGFFRGLATACQHIPVHGRHEKAILSRKPEFILVKYDTTPKDDGLNVT